MSNPRDVPPGDLPPRASNVPPTGSEPPQVNPQVPEGHQPPPQGYRPAPQGYSQAPGQTGYQAPGYQPPGAPGSQPPGPSGYQASGYQAPGHQAPGQPASPGGMRFGMPADRPRNFNEVMPQGGFSGMFRVPGMPTELKVSYWIWLIGGLLGLLGGIFGLFGSLVLLTMAPGLGLVVLLLVLVALALAAAQVILAMKMKEGREWARFALTVVAGISLALTIINAGAADGRGGGNWPSFLISLAATVLMWLPNSQAWFAEHRSRA
ncbi:MAG: hypothetical protein JWO49_1017 [Arthrobacter sp.]|nr:hypothetical protein [Arthrobacter sp.]MCU1549416.1 hypothetical protein [Arthrobacter sp.]